MCAGREDGSETWLTFNGSAGSRGCLLSYKADRTAGRGRTQGRPSSGGSSLPLALKIAFILIRF